MKRTQTEILREMVEGITQASGASSQLIHALHDPRFMTIRQALDLMKEGLLHTFSLDLNVVKHQPTNIIV